jgi:L-2-hydroxyglutarate oxidase LhgO
MESVDCVVIGAGVVGLAVARELAQAGRDVLVLERETMIGSGVSARNSEVVHAGLYYPQGSLKAQLCVTGKAMLYEFCESHHVAFRRCGKLVVATAPEQDRALEALAVLAQANGVPVQALDAAQVRALEPELTASSGLLSPTTGIVDSHGLMLALQGDLERAGGMVAVTSQVESLEIRANAQILVQTAEGTALLATTVVNAAGLSACALARATTGMNPELVPQEFFAKGSYFSLAGKSPFKHLVYPAPSGAWLGVHLTLDLGGQAKFGPDLEWLSARKEQEIDYAVQPERAQVFYEAIRRYWPGLVDGALQPAYSGVRPKIYGPNAQGQVPPASDFMIQGPNEHGIPGLVNLFGIESPGLTSSLAIAHYVRKLCD